jgi:hypothetical protein
MELTKILSLALQALTLLGVLFAVYQYFRKPDEDAATKIALLEQGCGMKHTVIDAVMTTLNQEIATIKNNHLKHIEESVRSLEMGQEKLFTILEERLPKK